MDMFAGGGGVPTYFFQIVVGLYVVEIVYVLSILVNGIENGSDPVGEHALIGENVGHSTMTYVILSLIVVIMFMGRIGLLALAIPRSKPYPVHVLDYPEGEVMIG